jgi:predicted Zn-dependent protease
VHASWSGWFAAAVAERRRGRHPAARAALQFALQAAPGATPAHLEMAAVLVALREPVLAVTHAERAVSLEGESPRTLGTLAQALLAAGRRVEGRAAAERAFGMDPEDATLRTLVGDLRRRPTRTGLLAGLRRALFGQ